MLKHKVEKIQNTLESAKSFLASLAVEDNDFNGNNGPEFRWERAKGYDCNFDYLEDYLSDIKDPRKYIERFIQEWFDEDSFYYDEYSVRIIKDDSYLIVSVVYTTN